MITMKLIYLVAAIGGGALLVIQIAMSLLGVGHDGDIDHDVGHAGDHGDGVSLFSFRALVAFLAFFGTGGMAAGQAGMGSIAALGIATGAGVTAFLFVGFALIQFNKLRSSGTVDIANAVGAEGTVYLIIPARGEGEGSVTVPIQGRTMQFKAITKGPELRTGALCRVVAVRSVDTLEVESV